MNQTRFANCHMNLRLLCLAFLAAVSLHAAPPEPAWMESALRYSESTGGQAMLVMLDGKIVFEGYGNGGGKDRRQTLASGTKSFTGVLAAAAVEDGFIKLDAAACESLAEWKSDPLKSRITYRQLLTLTSGLTPGERGEGGRNPAWKEVIAKPMSGQPGAQFEYGAYHLNAFGEALERKLKTAKGESFEQYLTRRVLQPLGITLEWRVRCPDGHPQLGGGAAMTARDWAAFGEFMRLGGQWNGKQLVRGELLADCLKATPQNPAYGLTWWLKETVPDAIIAKVPILQRDMGDIVKSDWLPEDLHLAAGAGKQRLYVIPSQKLVIVRQGDLTASRTFSDAAFLDRLLRGAGERETPAEKPTTAGRPATSTGGTGGAIIDRLDADRDGTVSKDEFKKFNERSQGQLKDNPDNPALERWFQRLDADGNGSLSAEEMKSVGSHGGDAKPGQQRRGSTTPAASQERPSTSATHSATGPHQVREIEFRIPAERWQQTMALRVYFPTDGGPFPLIVFCAGSAGGNDTFAGTSTLLASHGYVVLHTSYDLNARGGGNSELTRNRVADVVLALDSLDKLPGIKPELKDKIDATRVGAAGHSSGAYITQLLGGATVVFEGKETSFRDERIKAIIQFSGQGSDQQGLAKDSWKSVTIPMLTFTGTKDRGATGGGPEWKKEPFDHSPPGNKHHACYERGHHGSFSGRFASDANGRAIFEHSQRLALAFFDAYLKGDEKSLAALKSNQPANWNEARLDYFHR
jgi:CubicO group peptidase (beta-lactamase class C family)/predicted dienelactone hydrolase